MDDELVASKDRNNQRKTVTDQKRGSEGPVYDAVVDASENKMYGARLRAKGESEIDNIKNLLGTLPDLVSNEQSVKTKFDRGYGKLSMIQIPAERNYDVLTVAAASGSKHCFLTQEEVDKKVKELRSKGKEDKLINAMLSAISPFILPDNNAMGSLVRMAKRTVTLESDKSCVLYAIAIHETQDPKKC